MLFGGRKESTIYNLKIIKRLCLSFILDEDDNLNLGINLLERVFEETIVKNQVK